MIVYNAGKSLSDKLCGIEVNNNTYFCSSEVYSSDPVEKEFVNMVSYLEGNGIAIASSDRITHSVTTVDDDIYTLCVKHTPLGNTFSGNIADGLDKCLFVKDMVYQDENGNIAYVHNQTKYDIQHRLLECNKQNWFDKNYSNFPSVVERILRYVVLYNFNIGDNIQEVLRYATPRVPNKNMFALIKMLSEKNNNNLMSCIFAYNGLRKYILDMHNIKLEFTLK